MATDEERREVARHLRSNANKNEHMPLILNVAFSAFGFTGCSDRTVTAREAALNIADLIEPMERTCRDDGSGEAFRCSACGAFTLRGLVTDLCGVIPMRYCPNCGARVVE